MYDPSAIIESDPFYFQKCPSLKDKLHREASGHKHRETEPEVLGFPLDGEGIPKGYMSVRDKENT